MAATITRGEDQLPISEPAANSSNARNLFPRIKLIPWREIWESMFSVRIRGSAEITEDLINSIVEDTLVDEQAVGLARKQSL
jgi:hypothetical protein